jgi:DNA-binding PadR family transcriptional regulator
LLILQHDEAHDYALLAELEQFGFNLEQLDPSLVYCALRKKEHDGWIQSRWGEETQGPPQRVDSLDRLGEEHFEEHLAVWIEDPPTRYLKVLTTIERCITSLSNYTSIESFIVQAIVFRTL